MTDKKERRRGNRLKRKGPRVSREEMIEKRVKDLMERERLSWKETPVNLAHRKRILERVVTN